MHAADGNRSQQSSRWGTAEIVGAVDGATAMQALDRSELGGRTIFARLDRPDEFGMRSTAVPGRHQPVGAVKLSGNADGTVPHRLFLHNLPFSASWQDVKDHIRDHAGCEGA